MMDKLPIISAKPETVKAVNQSTAEPNKDTTKTFGAVFAKQVAKEDAASTAKKQTDTDSVANEVVAPIDETTALVQQFSTEDIAPKVDADFIDAQMLAMQATQASLDEVTDGEVEIAVDVDIIKDKEIAVTDTADSNTPIKTDVEMTDTSSVIPGTGALAVPITQGQTTINTTDQATLADDVNTADGAQRLKAEVKDVGQGANQKVALTDKNQAVNDQQLASSAYQAKQEVAMQGSAQQSQLEAVSALSQNAAPLSNIQQSQTVATMAQVPGSSNSIQASPGKAGWSEAISQKIVWMVGATEQSATLTLNPKDLGPLQVVIQVNNEKADATFISENPEVRKALEDGMTQLRQSMSQNGIELGQANVNSNKQHEAFQQASNGRFMQQNHQADGADATGLSDTPQSMQQTRVSNGLVDTFA